MTRRLIAKLLTFVLTLAAVAGSAGTAEAFPPGQGPGGPILVISDPSDPFDRYYAEILTAEGLNAFEVRNVDQVSAATLGSYSVVILASDAPALASSLSAWVQGGGNLIAMRPGTSLAGLLGLGSDTGDLDNRYIRVATGSAPGAGITSDTMQFHDRADIWTAPGVTRVAHLYTSATGATANPAVTLRSVGTAGGQAAAFTYDLARSVVYTRQGNPAWEGDERDFELDTLSRSDDMFYGADPDDPQPDWVDLNKVAIPQADEQQRLLANLITDMNRDRMPLPRFWYLPRGEKAAVIMTGDDHGNNGTEGQFTRFQAQDPPNCNVAEWECIRASSYVYPNTPISDAPGWQAKGFEIALHVNTGCQDFTTASLRATWADQLAQFRQRWPTLASPRTNRNHCIVWSDWASSATVEREFGVRLDTNYYYWPGKWVLDRPGMFTGSGFPQRFADRDGTLIDVYQATTQLTDESEIDYAKHIRALLENALGAPGYYGVFTTNMHTDNPNHPGANTIVAEAKRRGVPVVSAAQMLEWLDGRDNSSFAGLNFDGSRLRFTLNQASGARGLEAMVPAATAAGSQSGLTRNGAPVATSPRLVKGIEYLVFAAAPGEYMATYGGGSAGGGATTPPEGIPADKLGPRVRVRPRRVRASRRGMIKLRVSCPRGEQRCRIDLRVRRAGTTVAGKKFQVAGGRTRRISVRLKPSARRALSRSRSVRVVAVAAARDAAGNRATTRTRVRVLAPRRR